MKFVSLVRISQMEIKVYLSITSDGSFNVAKIILARRRDAKQYPDSLKHNAYNDCGAQARIKHELYPMIQANASDVEIAKRVFDIKMNDEDEYLSSHCFYVCVFDYMGLIEMPGGKMKENRKTVAFGEKLRKRFYSTIKRNIVLHCILIKLN
uniref:Uncharacterized protein n=1 Tax=Glossina austeni TaxID=7395 RepID=A0A1A9VS53_GLOAU